jgi:hypothetical protein
LKLPPEKIRQGTTMCLQFFFVKLDADTGPVRRDQVTILPIERLFYNFIKKASGFVDTLLNQEIRDVGVYLDSGRGDDRPSPYVRGHEYVTGFSERSDFFAGRDSTATAEVGLSKGACSFREKVLEFIQSDQPFTRGYRYGGASGDPAHFLIIFWRAGLLEP